MIRHSDILLDLEWKENPDLLVSELSTINQKISGLGSKDYSTYHRELLSRRISLMKAIMNFALPAGRKKHGWNVIGHGLKGGSPSSPPGKDLIFANESSNESLHSEDFILANSSSDDESSPKVDVQFLNPLESILYPIIESSPVPYPELNIFLV